MIGSVPNSPCKERFFGSDDISPPNGVHVSSRYCTHWIYSVNIILTMRVITMTTLWHGNVFRINGPLWRESSHHKGSVKRSSDIFAVVSRSKLFNKQLRCWRFETPWHSCDATVMTWPNLPDWNNETQWYINTIKIIPVGDIFAHLNHLCWCIWAISAAGLTALCAD